LFYKKKTLSLYSFYLEVLTAVQNWRQRGGGEREIWDERVTVGTE
jgi:hypothetical protein